VLDQGAGRVDAAAAIGAIDRQGDAAESRAERDRLGHLEPGAQTAAGDELQAETVEHQQRSGGGNAPIREHVAQRAAAFVAAQHLDPHPRRAARPGDIDVPHAGVAQCGANGARHPAAGLLRDDRYRQLGTETLQRRIAAAKIAIALALNQFLRRVEVQAEPVGADAVDQRA
jgi:hypothetical protein